MPNYNHAAYLPASIDGMLRQSRPADEIIIVDDASTDDSLAIISRSTAGHAAVHVVRNPRQGGVVRALNAGLAMASGDLLAFVGADDMLSPHFNAALAPLLEAHPEAAFGSARVELRDHADRKTGERPIIRPAASPGYVSPDSFRRQLRLGDNYFLGQVTLYRRSRLEELGGFDSALGSLSDSLLQRRLAARWGYVFVPDILGVWRVHGANYSVTSATDPAVLEAMIATARRVLADEPAGLYPPGYAELLERRLRFNSARLHAGGLGHRDDAADTMTRIMGGRSADRNALAGAARCGRLAPMLALSWLTLRLRPFAPSWLLADAGLRLAARIGFPGMGGASSLPPAK
jgi:glycosyltransferase involved in cell wall biosynthesis